MAPMSSPGAIRFSPGAGVLAVANDLVVFVSPAGPVADEWSDLAQKPATDAEIQAALRSELPGDHHLALLQLVDAGTALLAAPGAEPIRGSIHRSVDGVVRFGMHPGSDDHYWIGAGLVGASGFEVAGFAIADAPPAIEPSDENRDDAPPRAAPVAEPPSPRSEFFTQRDSNPPPPLLMSDAGPGGHDHPPVTPPGGVDAAVLPSALFPHLPTESDRPDVDPTVLSIRFDDGQELPLSQPLAVGRAPEGSADVPHDALVVVVSGDQVSRCHFLIRSSGTGAEVIDTHSLNGCFLEDPDRPGSGPQIPVGVPVRVEPGQRLRFGDRSFTLIAASEPT